MANRSYPAFTISKKGEAALRKGHPWVYDAEILTQEPVAENGMLVDVLSQKGKYLGTGYYSAHSKIRVRIISNNTNDKFDEAFYTRRLLHALTYRQTVMQQDITASRLVFGEADLFPGLTVDLFQDILVTQTLSMGIEKIKPLLFPLLVSLLEKEMGILVRGIFERNDVALREKEGLRQYKDWFLLPHKDTPTETSVVISENDISYLVDFENGQKTGYFLDQKYNRAAVGRLAKGKRVLDCFTHTGSFALNAARGGAEQVTAVDISAHALDTAKENAMRNDLSAKITLQEADVFALLPTLKQEAAKFDFIILDPPAFTKSRATLSNAMGGYREINKRAMQLLPRGGYLATCSCSHFVTEGMFRSMLGHAAADAGVSLRQIEARAQSPDHPILWNVPETNYLKFYIFQIY